MPRISTTGEELDQETKDWLKNEYQDTFARCRGDLCSHTDLVEFLVPRILCEGCFSSTVDGVFVTHRWPDVVPDSWEGDLGCLLDEDVVDELMDRLAADPDYALRCAACLGKVRPWEGESLYVETVDLGERLGTSDETGSVSVSRRRRREVLRAYGRKCLGCGRTDVELEVDHIQPKSLGGTASFENLQPLCRGCNNRKGNRAPARVVICRNPWPSDRDDIV
jgi:5-methylcytosine-specific restriction endonuclease McrA